MFLKANNPFFLAAIEYSRTRNISPVKSVEFRGKNLWIYYGDGSEAKVPIEELHDMAEKHVAPINPSGPIKVSDLLDHFKKTEVSDLSDVPLPPMKREFEKVETDDGYRMEEKWVLIQPVKDKKKKKSTTRATVGRALEQTEKNRNKRNAA